MASDKPVFRLPKTDLDRLLHALSDEGYRTVAPVERDGAVMWDEVGAASELPWGRREVQEPGRYRLEDGDEGRCFDIVNGPGSLKSLTFTSREKLTDIRRTTADGAVKIDFYPAQPKAQKTAVLGVRACDLAALAMQQRILEQGEYADPFFAARRASLFLIAVHCTRSAATCFCVSMGTGPKATSGFDLAMTELDELFLVEAGSEAGAAILSELALEAAGSAETDEAGAAIAASAAGQQRKIDHQGLPAALYEAHNHKNWDAVAERCLSCTNCTMVCPTCFCHAVDEVPAMDGSGSERFRIWDSCFAPDHGYIHGKNMRPTTRERYRMWMTHKLGSWIDQFGASGCVGCGRCTTWCPAAIDFTTEYAKVRERE